MPARLPKTTVLEAARDRLEAARADFAHAFEPLLSQVDLTAVETAWTAWRQAAEAFAETARRLYEEASAYFDAQSEKWQDSEQGLALAVWRDELEQLADFDGAAIEEVHIRINLAGTTPVAALEREPSDALPESPDIPDLEA